MCIHLYGGMRCVEIQIRAKKFKIAWWELINRSATFEEIGLEIGYLIFKWYRGVTDIYRLQEFVLYLQNLKYI